MKRVFGLSASRIAFLEGIRATFPLLMGIVPFGMVCGASAVAAGLDVQQAITLSWMVFAGSSQIVFAQLLSQGAPAWAILLTAWIVNLRFLMYSAALAPHFRGETETCRWWAAYLLTDQSFALMLARIRGGQPYPVVFFFGVAIGSWLPWQMAILAGILFGVLVPSSWSMDFTVALTFIAFLVPVLSDRPKVLAALVGGVVCVLIDLPFKLNILAATLSGIAAGLLAGKWISSKSGA